MGTGNSPGKIFVFAAIFILVPYVRPSLEACPKSYMLPAGKNDYRFASDLAAKKRALVSSDPAVRAKAYAELFHAARKSSPRNHIITLASKGLRDKNKDVRRRSFQGLSKLAWYFYGRDPDFTYLAEGGRVATRKKNQSAHHHFALFVSMLPAFSRLEAEANSAVRLDIAMLRTMLGNRVLKRDAPILRRALKKYLRTGESNTTICEVVAKDRPGGRVLSPEILKLSAGGDGLMEYHCALSLGQMGPFGINQLLKRLRGNPRDAVMRNYGNILSRHNPLPRHALPVILSMLKHSDPYTRLRAIEMLVAIGRPLEPRRIEAIREKLQDPFQDVRLRAGYALVQLAPRTLSRARRLRYSLIACGRQFSFLQGPRPGDLLAKWSPIPADEPVLLQDLKGDLHDGCPWTKDLLHRLKE